MSKLWCYLLLLGIVAVQGLPKRDDEPKPEALTQNIEPRTVFDDFLRELVEYLRMQMPCGYEKAGIPPLAPYYAESLELNRQTKHWDIRGNIRDLFIAGLDKFVVRKLSWNHILQMLSFEFYFDELLMSGQQNISVITRLFGPPATVHGDGDLLLSLSDIRFFGSFLLRPTLGGKLQLWNFRTSIELGDVKSQFTGIMDSALWTKLFNSWVEEFVGLLFSDSPAEVTDALQHLITPRANNVLKHYTVVELLALILGLVEKELPNEPWC